MINNFSRSSGTKIKSRWLLKHHRLLGVNIPFFKKVYIPEELTRYLEKAGYSLNNQVKLHLGYHKLTLTSHQFESVLECSFNQLGAQRIQNNFRTLQQLKVFPVPQPLTLHTNKQFTHATYEKIIGNKINLRQAQSLPFDKIINYLKPMYSAQFSSNPLAIDHLLSTPLLINNSPAITHAYAQLSQSLQAAIPPKQNLIQGLVHGDLTFDNILSSGKSLCFLDFEYAVIAPIEWDVLTYHAYLRTMSSRNNSYINFFNQLSLSLQNVATIPEIEILYRQIPRLCQNQPHHRPIILSLIGYSLCKIVENNQHNARLCLDLINKVQANIKRFL